MRLFWIHITRMCTLLHSHVRAHSIQIRIRRSSTNGCVSIVGLMVQTMHCVVPARLCAFVCMRASKCARFLPGRSVALALSLSLTFLSFHSGRPLFCDKIASAFRLYTVKPILRSASNTCFLLSALHSIAERLVRTSRTRSVTSDIFYISVCILVLCYRSAISIKINGLHFASKFLVI